MATSVQPTATGREAPAGSVAPETAPDNKGIIPAIHKPQTMSIAEAAEAARKDYATKADEAKKAAVDSAAGEQGATDEQEPVDGGEQSVEGEQGAEGEQAPDAVLVVQLDPDREGDEPIELTLPDQATADLLRSKIKGALRGEQARQIRDQAQQIREEAEEIPLQAKLDPAGFVLERIGHNAEDVEQLFRYLATRPGMIERTAEWLADMIEKPDLIRHNANAEEIARRDRADEMGERIAEERQINSNARALRNAAVKVTETLAPEAWDEESRTQFTRDVLTDVRDYARAKSLMLVDPGVVSGLAQRRLKLLGVAARSASAPADATPTGAPRKGAAPTGQPTGKQFVKAAEARRSAGAAPPGAGSPSVSAIPKAPKGSTIKEAIIHARKAVAARLGRPT